MTKSPLIIVDSSVDLTQEFCKEREVIVLPFAININNKEYFDGVDIDTVQLFGFVEQTKKLPKTAARSTADMIDLVNKHRADGQEVIWISISSILSSNGINAKMAMQQLGDEQGGFYYVDSKSLSGGVSILVKIACDLRDEGKNAKEIADTLREQSQNIQASFVVETLEYLHKGGRCSGVVALIGGILKIRPSLKLVDGAITVGKKYKGSYDKVVECFVNDTIDLNPNYDSSLCVITHCLQTEEMLQAIQEQINLKSKFNNIMIINTGSTIATHCGKGTIGLFWLNKG